MQYRFRCVVVCCSRARRLPVVGPMLLGFGAVRAEMRRSHQAFSVWGGVRSCAACVCGVSVCVLCMRVCNGVVLPERGRAHGRGHVCVCVCVCDV